jgi:Ca-activated chloride channel family protein
MKIVEPFWYWFILALPVVWLLGRWLISRRFKLLEKFSQRDLWKSVIPGLFLKGRSRKLVLLCFALLFALIALSRPQYGSHEETLKIGGMDILIVLDLSKSMDVEDIVPSRLKKAKHALRGMLEGLSGDRVGMVAFAGSAQLVSPLTTDLDYVNENLQSLETSAIKNQGTNIGEALKIASEALYRGAQDSTREKLDPASQATKAVILVSDGEDLEEQGVQGARLIEKNGAKFFVLGVGTTSGGPVPLRDENGVLLGYKKQGANPVISTFSPNALEQIARAGGGRYFGLSESEREIDVLLKDLSGIERNGFIERKFTVFKDYYQVFVGLALLFLVIELCIPVSITQTAVVLIFGFSILFSRPVHAETGADTSDPSLYYKTYRGLKALEKGNVDEATSYFNEAKKQAPNRAETYYNQGTAALAQKNINIAEQEFRSAIEKSEQAQNPAMGGIAQYNLGEILKAQKQNPLAIESLIESINLSKSSGNHVVEGFARQKLEQLLEEQKKEGDGGQSKDPSKDGKESDKKDGKEKSESKPQQAKETTEEQKKQQFKSEQLKPEDAEKVFAELSNREKQLQKDLRQKGAKPKDTKGKDW